VASAQDKTKATHKKPTGPADFHVESVNDIKDVAEHTINELLAAGPEVDLLITARVISQLLITSCKILHVGDIEECLRR
jgi:hypothetical protein